MSHNAGDSWWDQSYRKLLQEYRIAGSVSSQPFLFIYNIIVPLGFLSPLAALSSGLCQLGLINICAVLLSSPMSSLSATQRAFSTTIIFIFSSSSCDHIRGLETFNLYNRERYLFVRRDTVTSGLADYFVTISCNDSTDSRLVLRCIIQLNIHHQCIYTFGC